MLALRAIVSGACSSCLFRTHYQKVVLLFSFTISLSTCLYDYPFTSYHLSCIIIKPGLPWIRSSNLLDYIPPPCLDAKAFDEEYFPHLHISSKQLAAAFYLDAFL